MSNYPNELFGRQTELKSAGDGAHQVLASTEQHSVHKLFRLGAVLQIAYSAPMHHLLHFVLGPQEGKRAAVKR